MNSASCVCCRSVRWLQFVLEDSSWEKYNSQLNELKIFILEIGQNNKNRNSDWNSLYSYGRLLREIYFGFRWLAKFIEQICILPFSFGCCFATIICRWIDDCADQNRKSDRISFFLGICIGEICRHPYRCYSQQMFLNCWLINFKFQLEFNKSTD